MHNLLDSTSAAPGDGPIEYSTRVVPLSKVDARVVLPYVLAVLEGVGLGVAQAVEGISPHGGILLTTPVGISHFLDATIKQSLDSATLKEFGHAVFYPPAVMVEARTATAGAPAGSADLPTAADIQNVIERLGLIPPDMKCQCVQIDDQRAAILVSGPAGPREERFKTAILPSLSKLVHSLERSGFPLS